MISNTFSQTAESIMQHSEKNQSKAPIIVTVVLIAILAMIIIYALVKNRSKKKKENTNHPVDIIIEKKDIDNDNK